MLLVFRAPFIKQKDGTKYPFLLNPTCYLNRNICKWPITTNCLLIHFPIMTGESSYSLGRCRGTVSLFLGIQPIAPPRFQILGADRDSPAIKQTSICVTKP